MFLDFSLERQILKSPENWILGSGTVGCTSGWRAEVAGSTPAKVGNSYFLSLSLIQEGQLSVSGERMYSILVNHLED